MTKYWNDWNGSSATQENQTTGKSVKAVLICFRGEKKQMHSATMEWLLQELQPLDVFFF